LALTSLCRRQRCWPVASSPWPCHPFLLGNAAESIVLHFRAFYLLSLSCSSPLRSTESSVRTTCALQPAGFNHESRRWARGVPSCYPFETPSPGHRVSAARPAHHDCHCATQARCQVACTTVQLALQSRPPPSLQERNEGMSAPRGRSLFVPPLVRHMGCGASRNHDVRYQISLAHGR
jgi:hypothetical protein